MNSKILLVLPIKMQSPGRGEGGWGNSLGHC